MKNKALWIVLIVFVAVLAVAGILYSRLGESLNPQQLATTPTEPAPEPEAATEPTQPEPVTAPDFAVLDWEGNEVHFSDYVGKPIVLNFWAHWCGPCQTEMPEFNEVYEELGGEVTFLMVHVGADQESGKEKVTQGGYTFPVVFDTQSTAAAIYGVNAFPTSFFIDKEGNLAAYYVGMMDRELLQQGVDLACGAE